MADDFILSAEFMCIIQYYVYVNVMC